MKLSLVEKKKENFLSVIRRLYKRNSSSSSLESKNFAIIQALDGSVFPVKVFILFLERSWKVSLFPRKYNNF